MKTDRSAVVLGATGLVGSELVRQLLEDPAYARVITLGRRPLDLNHDKLVHHVIDFEERDAFAQLVSGDVVFSALGTTIQTAGSKDAQWRVDFDYQFWALKAAEKNGVGAAVLVSSTGARASSRIFYLRMKGKLDEEVMRLAIPSVTILRPSMLDGDRKEHRPGEKIGLSVARRLPAWAMLASLRAVPVSVVARAARVGASEGAGKRIWEAHEVFERGAG